MHAHLIISGQVQGVGFRYSAQQQATKHGLVGWVMNREDGTVEMKVEGSEDQISEYIIEIRNGFHQFIHVDNIELEKSNNEKGYKNFDIK